MDCLVGMRIHAKRKVNPRFNERLARRGLRFTSQRQEVYEVLLARSDHPTAEQVFIRAKKEMPDISMATVYNCLDALVKCGLARQVTLDRGATRFCPNMQDHGHFYCDSCESVFDVNLPAAAGSCLPKGFKAERFDIAIHGLCPACSNEKG
jgi:Fur family transcriptional regulator, peroxide stress response regulator